MTTADIRAGIVKITTQSQASNISGSTIKLIRNKVDAGNCWKRGAVHKIEIISMQQKS